MPFDKLDKKAREAAEQYNAAYNEEAWSKMETLLDKHMPVGVEQPQIKERKFHEKWLLLLLSIVAISFVVLFTKPWKNSRINKGEAENNPTTKSAQKSNAGNTAMAIEPNEHNNIGHKSNVTNASINKPAGTILISPKSIDKSARGPYSKNAYADKDLTDINSDNIADIQISEPNVEAPKYQNIFSMDGFINQKISNRPIGNKNIISNNIFISRVPEADKTALAKTKRPYNSKKNKFANSFSLSLSAGPDVSAIDLNNLGAFEILYGAGIGYKFGKRWQLRTGFYSVKKVYGATPSDYNPPSEFWNYYPGLEDINADCRVNEIPLIINYTFRQNSRQAWFGSAGLSSYFMKRETYNYHSKTAWGYQDKSYTIYRENKHYLSSLRISAGYEKTFNRIISVSAEPYLNLPLSGIGYGKVKLNSAGLLFSVNVKPFARK